MIFLGVSACFMPPDPTRDVFGPKRLAYIEQDMARYLAKDNTIPILIPDLPDAALAQYLQQMDGFVLQGGHDVAPSSYRSTEDEPGRWTFDHKRDAYELKIIEYALNAKKPVLGICRGCQVLNVFFGGSLYQDLETDEKQAHPHRNAEQYDQLSHEITIEEGGALSNIYSNTKVGAVNSVHHQGIKDLGHGLRVEARSVEDKIIEAISLDDSDAMVIGVQWHPEFLYSLGDAALNPNSLISAFLEACRHNDL